MNSPHAEVRSNHFNLIRMVAASAVLVSHSYALATGNAQNEPLRTALGMTFGTIAVDVFFVTSGYLVTESIARRGSVAQFAWARALRIYPGLFVAVLLSTLACSLWFTTLALGEFWRSPQTWKYLAKNISLLAPSGIELRLPSTFMGVPWSKSEGGSVNSSLWTLPYELRMYLALAALFVAARWLARRRAGLDARAALRSLVLVVVVVLWPIDLVTTVMRKHDLVLHMSTMFALGAAFQLLDLRRRLHGGTAVALFVAIVAAGAIDRELFSTVYVLGVAYVALAAAYALPAPLLAYNRLGDYSYGVYIYAFPVQQSLAFLVPGITPWAMTALALPLALALAVLSWNLIEKRALTLKNRHARAPAPQAFAPSKT